MDIERMKKINSLIPELKRQGFAKTSAEAAVVSDSIFKNHEEDNVIQRISIVDQSRSPIQHNADQLKIEPSEQFHPRIAALERKFDQFDNSMNNIIEKMNEMIKVVTELEKMREAVRISNGTISKEVQQTIVPKKEEKEEKPQGHVRSGNYTSADVDINKIFYYGTK